MQTTSIFQEEQVLEHIHGVQVNIGSKKLEQPIDLIVRLADKDEVGPDQHLQDDDTDRPAIPNIDASKSRLEFCELQA